jgi:hypothetical protein
MPHKINSFHKGNTIEMGLTSTHRNVETEGTSISIFQVWCIPGVPFYALSYASIKGTCYGLLFWLAPYLKSQGMGEVKLDSFFSSTNTYFFFRLTKHSAGISQMNDLGQFFGGFILGVISDKLQKRF